MSGTGLGLVPEREGSWSCGLAKWELASDHKRKCAFHLSGSRELADWAAGEDEADRTGSRRG